MYASLSKAAFERLRGGVAATTAWPRMNSPTVLTMLRSTRRSATRRR